MPQGLSFTIVANVVNPLSVVQPPAGADPRPIPDGPTGSTFQVVAAGGTPPYHFSLPSPPPGWTIDANTGLLTRGQAATGVVFECVVTDSSSP